MSHVQLLPKLSPRARSRIAYTVRACGDPAYTRIVNGLYALTTRCSPACCDRSRDAARSPLAVWGSKEMITYARDHSVADGLNYIATWQTGMFQPADLTEAFVARAEKRDAIYDDLQAVRRGLE